MGEKCLFTSESVGEGHPDKVCDRISDAVLDHFISRDRESRVAAECFVKNNFLIIGGEVTSKIGVDEKDIENLARSVIRDLGYTKKEYGFDDQCDINVLLSRQSPDIAQGVNESARHEQGAGDQGIMFGFACNETPELLPLPISLSHRIMIKLSEIRRSGRIRYLRPDAKCQVTIEYKEGKPERADTIVLSAQHDPDVSIETIKKDLIEKVIKLVCGEWIDDKTIFHINPTGKFVIGGPAGDTGLTGRKIIVDTYGGYSRHGGGCFSGKDPSKVDRSAAYAARYVAKNIVASGIADKCEVQLAYAIGVAEPVSIHVDCFGTNKIPLDSIIGLIRKHFPLKPREIINKLDLKRPIYKKTASFGHFGRNDSDFSWEKLDKAEDLNKDLSN